MMNLPSDFTRNIHNAFPGQGEQWLANLPSLLDEAACKWDLTLGEPLLLSYNYVCAAKRADGTDVVLKIGVPHREFTSELTALRHFNGDGAVRLLEADDKKCMFVMERLKPGEMLASLKDDEKRTEIASDVMLKIWRTAPQGLPLIQLSDWFGELSKLRPRYGGGTGPFPKKLVERVESLLPELFATSRQNCLIHGDFHHFNILSSERGWLIIDPKGVIGPSEYECGPLLLNPIPDLPYKPEAARLTERRIAILSERLGFSRERIRDWGICHALLSAWWDLAEDNTGGEYSMACAEMIASAKI
jgi:streptomycin 6-kinase